MVTTFTAVLYRLYPGAYRWNAFIIIAAAAMIIVVSLVN